MQPGGSSRPERAARWLLGCSLPPDGHGRALLGCSLRAREAAPIPARLLLSSLRGRSDPCSAAFFEPARPLRSLLGCFFRAREAASIPARLLFASPRGRFDPCPAAFCEPTGPLRSLLGRFFRAQGARSSSPRLPFLIPGGCFRAAQLLGDPGASPLDSHPVSGCTGRGRVALGGCPPRAPTDPDVRNCRIRLFETQIRYAGRACAGVRSG